MLLCDECYENVYALGRTNYPSFNAYNGRVCAPALPRVNVKAVDL
jgi:hypothetical protein